MFEDYYNVVNEFLQKNNVLTAGFLNFSVILENVLQFVDENGRFRKIE